MHSKCQHPTSILWYNITTPAFRLQVAALNRVGWDGWWLWLIFACSLLTLVFFHWMNADHYNPPKKSVWLIIHSQSLWDQHQMFRRQVKVLEKETRVFYTWFYSERWQIREDRVTQYICECYTEGRQWQFIVATSAYVTGKFPRHWNWKNSELIKYSFYPIHDWVVNFIVWGTVNAICLSTLKKLLGQCFSVPVSIFSFITLHVERAQTTSLLEI